MQNMFLDTVPNTSLEAIGRLAGDKIVDDVVEFISKLRVISRKDGLRSGDSLSHKDKETRGLLLDIETKISKRFGLKYHVGLEPNSNYIYISPITELGATAGNDIDWWEYLSETFDDHKHTKNEEMRYEKGESFSRKIYNTTKDTRDKLLNTPNDLRIDMDKAIIYGMEDNWAGSIYIDPVDLFNIKASDREIAAILFHEIGHGFNKVATLNKTYGSVLGTMEGLVASKGDEKKIVGLVNEMFNSSYKDSKDIIYAFVKGEFLNVDDNLYTYTNNESSADQFATRFGLGKELVTVFSRFYGISLEANRTRKGDVIKTTRKVVELLLIAVLLSVLFMISAYIVPALTPIILIVMYANSIMMWANIIKLVYFSFFKDYEEKEGKDSLNLDQMQEFTYDEIYDRMNKVKKDLIRQMRTLDISKEEKKKIVEEIKGIDKMIGGFKKKFKKSDLSKAFNMIKIGQDAISKREFFIRIEELTENDLHYQSEKFKTLLG